MNLASLGGMIFVLANQWQKESAAASVSSEVKPPVPLATIPAPSAPSGMKPETFRWNQLVSVKDYRVYIANLRAIGCPETTIEDIVRGDADRAFSWERKQLGLDGSGSGPWSRSQEVQLVASLLGGQPAETVARAQNPGNQVEGKRGVELAGTSALEQNATNQAQEDVGGEVAQVSVPSQSTGAGVSHYPLFLQDVNWSALGFTASQQAAIAQVRQQFLSEINGPNQNPGDPAGQNSNSATPDASQTNPDPNDPAILPRWQKALQDADPPLRDLLGSQGYMAYEQYQYDSWFQSQLAAADAAGEPLAINPTAFSLK